MKKTGKRLLALLAILPLVFSFTGCMALDEMRAQHAFWIEEEECAILWGDTVYKEIPSGFLHLDNQDADSGLYVTEPDVPVLLSPTGSFFNVYEDGQFLYGWSAFSLYTGYRTFCREDRYQEIMDRINAPFVPESLCYFYTVYDLEEDRSVSYHYALTDQQVTALATVTENVTPEVVGEGWYMDYDTQVVLWECSGDLLMRREAMELVRAGSTYYIRIFENQQYHYFTVPAELNGLCAEILHDYDHRFDEPIEPVENDV